MTSSLPDSFSFSDLQAMLESAPKEEEVRAEQQSSDDEGITQESLLRAADAGLELMLEHIHDPVVHKAALIQIANNMVMWHTKVGENCFAEGETESGTAWLRDAGKWQSVLTTVMAINLGPNDCFVQDV